MITSTDMDLDYTNRVRCALFSRMVAARAKVEVRVADRGGAVTGPDEFCRRLHPRLVGALRLYLAEPEIARDLAQEALVRVIERWPRVSTMDHPEAWVYRVAFNLARSGLRRRKAERRAHDRNGAPATVAWSVDIAEVLAVRAAVSALPARQRQAVVLRYYGDLPLLAIAEAMACRPGTVKAHLHQAVATLRSAGLSGADDVGDDSLHHKPWRNDRERHPQPAQPGRPARVANHRPLPDAAPGAEPPPTSASRPGRHRGPSPSSPSAPSHGPRRARTSS
ncbi:MAG: SigE family RNA polymerase sigma factor [Acidimicrobiales bacterium]